MSNSVFNGNSNGDSGGAIYFSGFGVLQIESSTFVNNHVTYDGGAVYAEYQLNT